MSCTQGHVHTTDFAVRTKANGQLVMGLVAGCYVDFFMDWAGDANNQWWKGVIFCTDVHEGVYDPSWISLHTIKREYA